MLLSIFLLNIIINFKMIFNALRNMPKLYPFKSTPPLFKFAEITQLANNASEFI